MPEETPQLPVNEQEVQIEAPSLLDKIKAQKKKILIGLGSFLGVLILVGAVFGVYKHVQRQVSPPSQPIPTPIVEATPTPGSTVEWETYTNTEYGYSIRYPKDSELFEIGETTGVSTDEWQAVGLRMESLEVQILSYENEENLSSQEYAEKYASKLELLNKRETTIGGKLAYQYDYVDVRNDKEFPTRVVTIASDGYIIEIIGINKAQRAEFDTLDFILSTFEFLEEESCGEMTLAEAKEIALKSGCVKEGNLKETYSCNDSTGTWWLDLDVEKPGCAPACVVNVVTKEAEINWRCTGLIPE